MGGGDELLEEFAVDAPDSDDANYTLIWRLNPYGAQLSYDSARKAWFDSARKPAFLRRRIYTGSQRESLDRLDDAITQQMFLDQKDRKMPTYNPERLAEIETCKQWEDYNREVWTEHYSLTQTICDRIVTGPNANALTAGQVAGASIGAIIGAAVVGVLAFVVYKKAPCKGLALRYFPRSVQKRLHRVVAPV